MGLMKISLYWRKSLYSLRHKISYLFMGLDLNSKLSFFFSGSLAFYFIFNLPGEVGFFIFYTYVVFTLVYMAKSMLICTV